MKRRTRRAMTEPERRAHSRRHFIADVESIARADELCTAVRSVLQADFQCTQPANPRVASVEAEPAAGTSEVYELSYRGYIMLVS